MSTKQVLIALTATFAVGLATGRFTLPSKVEAKTVTHETKDKDQNTTVKRDVETTTTHHKDGSDTTVVVDHSVVETVKEEKDSLHAESEKVTTYSKPSLMIGMGVGMRVTSLKDGAVYSAQIQKRLLGPIWLGVTGQTDGYGGLSVHLQF